MYTILLKMKHQGDIETDVNNLIKSFVARHMSLIDAEIQRSEEQRQRFENEIGE